VFSYVEQDAEIKSMSCEMEQKECSGTKGRMERSEETESVRKLAVECRKNNMIKQNFGGGNGDKN
jgi:hypothetical protein